MQRMISATRLYQFTRGDPASSFRLFFCPKALKRTPSAFDINKAQHYKSKVRGSQIIRERAETKFDLSAVYPKKRKRLDSLEKILSSSGLIQIHWDQELGIRIILTCMTRTSLPTLHIRHLKSPML